MKFEEKFPSLMELRNYGIQKVMKDDLFTLGEIEENCLDKKKVRNILKQLHQVG